MKILLAHNYYQQAGGEDAVVANEQALLLEHDHQVDTFFVDNDAISGFCRRLQTAWQTAYSSNSRAEMARAIGSFSSDIVHVHNFFPLLTPSIYDACADAGVPVVQTLHNYRLMCARGDFLRDNHVCEKCLGGSALNAVLHGCYRGSRLGSLAVARMIERHRRSGIWETKVRIFIALTEFAKRKFIAAGLPAHRIEVKPNFVRDPGISARPPRGDTPIALFVGRISPEKGIETLIRAWARVSFPLVIAGDGVASSMITDAGLQNIRWVGRLSSEQVSAWMQRADFLVVPSIWYEMCPMVVIEAFAHGLPVFASWIGALAELIDDGTTGRLFSPGNYKELRDLAEWAVESGATLRKMGQAARATYEAKYSPQANYDKLEKIYRHVVGEPTVS